MKLDSPRERALVAAALRDAAWARILVAELGADRFEDPACRRIVAAMADVLARGEVPTFHVLEAELEGAPIELRPVLEEPVVAAAGRVLGGVPAGWARQEELKVGDSLLRTIANVPRVATGIPDLDKRLDGGLRAGDLILVGSWPGMGRTSLALEIARRVALDRPDRGLLCTPLARCEDVRERLIAADARLSRDRRLAAARQFRIVIEDYPLLTLGTIEAHARSLAATGLSLILLDDADELWRGSSAAEVLNALRSLARELAVPIVATVKLTESADGGSEPYQMVRVVECPEEGESVRHSDVLLLLHRPGYCLTEEDANARNLAGVIEVIVVKSGRGARSVRLHDISTPP